MKIALIGPINTLSGYGSLTRDTYRYLEPLGVEVKPVNTLEAQTAFDYRGYDPSTEYDIALYCFTPVDKTEDKMTLHWLSDIKAKKKVLLTAGIESDKVTSLWNRVTNEIFDYVIASTEHSKLACLNQTDPAPTTPIYVVTEGVDTDTFYRDETGTFNFSTPINFLSSGQVGLGGVGEDRKQIWQLVRDFTETFEGNKDVGLILKIWMSKYNSYERDHLLSIIKKIKHNKKYPAIHLVYGALNRDQLRQLYSHPSIRAYVSLSSGEGFGRGFIEAAACKTPVMAIWETGQKDFLLENCIYRVDADLKPTSRAYTTTVPYFMAEDSRWWYSKPESVRTQLLAAASISRESIQDKLDIQYRYIVDNHSKKIAAEKLIEALKVIFSEEK